MARDGGIIRWLFGSSPNVSQEGLSSKREFKLILERERSLVDRNNRMFSVLIFGSGNSRYHRESVRALMDVLSRRLRKTDIVGWLDRQSIGVMMPDTPPAGAWIVGNSVCQLLASDSVQPTCTVWTYPAEQPPKPVVHDPAQMELFGADEVVSANPAPEEDASSGGEAAPASDARHLVAGLPIPWWKRAVDIAGSGLGLILVSPLILTSAAAVKLLSPGPAFLKQERVGHLGRRFHCWKIRSMHVNADTGIHQQHLKQLMQANTPMTKLDKGHDPRVIPVIGKVLRASGIDELPQLLNVLWGDMSLIGPRPCLPYEYDGYQQWQKKRFDGLPGLTGLWQVSGKNRTTFVEMMRLDIAYTQRKSVWLDGKIFFRTLPTLVNEVRDVLGGKRKGRK